MNKERCLLEIMKLIDMLFTPTKEENEKLRERLLQLNEQELTNLYNNFDLMGIDVILEYLYNYYIK